jgi:hypothetical protein
MFEAAGSAFFVCFFTLHMILNHIYTAYTYAYTFADYTYIRVVQTVNLQTWKLGYTYVIVAY